MEEASAGFESTDLLRLRFPSSDQPHIDPKSIFHQ
jgi:hypothetical protein